ncbi:MAG: amidohydrolase [Candidatus Dormibacteraeota bacterium]|nr:amidohydrolase [Candidatus Dormibacteraeota bacterium]
MIIDTHSHLFPPSWQSAGHMPVEMFDVGSLLERQHLASVDVSIVSDPHIWYGDVDLSGIERTRQYNDFAAELTRAQGGRVVGLGSVTPWLGVEHIQEAERAIRQLGLPGLAIATSHCGRYLDAIPEDFWQLVEALRVPLFLHPGGSVLGQEAMESYRLAEVCGRPLDTTLALSRFILTGTFDRHPSLRVLCAHAGGAICAIADRLDFGHELRAYQPLGPWGPVELSEPPSAFVSRLYLDTVTYGPKPLRLALETVGARQLCYGSDNPPVPFPLSRSLAVIAALRVTDVDSTRILGGNALDLFGLGSQPTIPEVTA